MRNNKQIVVYFQLTCKLNKQKTIFVYNNYHFDNFYFNAGSIRVSGEWRKIYKLLMCNYCNK